MRPMVFDGSDREDNDRLSSHNLRELRPGVMLIEIVLALHFGQPHFLSFLKRSDSVGSIRSHSSAPRKLKDAATINTRRNEEKASTSHPAEIDEINAARLEAIFMKPPVIPP